MLYNNRSRYENTDAVAGLSIPMGYYEWIYDSVYDLFCRSDLSDAGSSSCKFETSYLTLNRPGFLESSTAGEEGGFPPV